MGRIRDELYDTMWDSWTCSKHDETMIDRRFSCPKCEEEREIKKKADEQLVKEILLKAGYEADFTLYGTLKRHKELTE